MGSCEKRDRLGAHSHVKGLGVDGGLVGQSDAREGLSLLVDLIRGRRLAGKGILLAGPPATGKTALAYAVGRELGSNTPFVCLTASEVFSAEVKKTEILLSHFRRAIGIRTREVKDVYEGEVLELSAEETESPHGELGRTIAAVIICLKTAKGTKTLRLAPQINENLKKQKTQVGDVIFIEACTGVVKRLGRSDRHRAEFDLELDEFLPLPKGEVHKKKEIVQDVTLHDLDVANARPSDGNDVLSFVGKYMNVRKTEITEKLRTQVNKSVNKYIEEGTAELLPGVLFIDEVHMLDIECFAFLNRILESPFSPIVIFATNRGISSVKGGDFMVEPHGLPVDLLDRLVIVKTLTYQLEEITQIIALRAKMEKLTLEEDALAKLAIIGQNASLRFALGLLEPARILNAQGTHITLQDIHQVDSLFIDAKTSAKRLAHEAHSFVS